MAPVVTSAEIDRRAAKVFAYATDPAFTGHGIGKILVPLMVGREARKEMPANMTALKHKMEAG